MGEPRCSEILSNPLRKPLVLAEDDAQHQRAPHTGHAKPHSSFDSVDRKSVV